MPLELVTCQVVQDEELKPCVASAIARADQVEGGSGEEPLQIHSLRVPGQQVGALVGRAGRPKVPEFKPTSWDHLLIRKGVSNNILVCLCSLS